MSLHLPTQLINNRKEERQKKKELTKEVEVPLRKIVALVAIISCEHRY